VGLELQHVDNENTGENDAYSLFVYAIRSQTTKDTYLRRLRIFFNHIRLMSNDEPMEVRCKYFTDRAKAALFPLLSK